MYFHRGAGQLAAPAIQQAIETGSTALAPTESNLSVLSNSSNYASIAA